MTEFKKYLLILSCFSFGLFLIALSTMRFLPEKFSPSLNVLIGLFLFFTVATAMMHLFLLNASKGKPQEFVRAFTGTFAAKLFSYISVLLIYRLMDKEGFLPFAFCFLCLYAFFLVFEVTALLRYFKK